jgi:hypothetical protein
MSKNRKKTQTSDAGVDGDSAKDNSEQLEDLADKAIKRDRSKQTDNGNETGNITIPARRRKGTRIENSGVVVDDAQQPNIFIQGATEEAGQGGLTSCRGPFLGWIGVYPGPPKAPSSGNQSGIGPQLRLPSTVTQPIRNSESRHSSKRWEAENRPDAQNEMTTESSDDDGEEN